MVIQYKVGIPEIIYTQQEKWTQHIVFIYSCISFSVSATILFKEGSLKFGGEISEGLEGGKGKGNGI